MLPATRLRRARGAAVLSVLLGVLLAGLPAGPAAAHYPAPEGAERVRYAGTFTRSVGIDTVRPYRVYDLRGFRHYRNPSPVRYPFYLGHKDSRRTAAFGNTVIGGRIVGNIPRWWKREQWYNSRYDGDGVRIVQRAIWSRVAHTYVENVSDAFATLGSPGARFTLDHVHAEYIRDDAVENDSMPKSITIRNSLFDGVFTFLSQRPKGYSWAARGTTPGTTRIENTLVYLKPQPIGRKYCPDPWKCPNGKGSNVLFKWSSKATRYVVVRDSIFRVDQRSVNSTKGMAFPPGVYENVTLVWLGAGDYPVSLPKGVRVTRDASVWTRARNNWLRGIMPG